MIFREDDAEFVVNYCNLCLANNFVLAQILTKIENWNEKILYFG